MASALEPEYPVGATERGFAPDEFVARTARAQSLMQAADLDALLLTTEPEVRYFSGFLTRFWESPTRPWFLIVPAQGQPVAVIPAIGAALMQKTWIKDIRTWPAPFPSDDGITLLADTLAELTQPKARIGVPDGPETHLRMPLSGFAALQQKLVGRSIVGDDGVLRRLRLIKSAAEIDKIETACGIAGRAFLRVPQIAMPGTPLAEVFRRFQMLCLEEGADSVPYLAGGLGPGGYDDVISPAGETALRNGDVLMLDTGLVHDGYFCDFDRNWAIGRPAAQVTEDYARLVDAAEAGFAAARPGITAADLYSIMARVLGDAIGAGRLGHGLGMSLTEWPSLLPDDHTVLEPGMVLTLEPGVCTPAGIMVHEENIVITQNAAKMLSPRAPERLPVL